MKEYAGKIINTKTNEVCYLYENIDDGAHYEVTKRDIEDFKEDLNDTMLYVGSHEDLKHHSDLNVYVATDDIFCKWKELQGMQERIDHLVEEIGEFPEIVKSEEERQFQGFSNLEDELDTHAHFLESYREAQIGRVCCYDSDDYDENIIAALGNLTEQQEIELNFLCRIEDYHDREIITKMYLEKLGLLK